MLGRYCLPAASRRPLVRRRNTISSSALLLGAHTSTCAPRCFGTVQAECANDASQIVYTECMPKRNSIAVRSFRLRTCVNLGMPTLADSVFDGIQNGLKRRHLAANDHRLLIRANDRNTSGHPLGCWIGLHVVFI